MPSHGGSQGLLRVQMPLPTIALLSAFGLAHTAGVSLHARPHARRPCSTASRGCCFGCRGYFVAADAQLSIAHHEHPNAACGGPAGLPVRSGSCPFFPVTRPRWHSGILQAGTGPCCASATGPACVAVVSLQPGWSNGVLVSEPV